MAHTKAGGTTRQKGNRRGKRLGVKIFGGQRVVSGNVLIRQKGSKYHPGVGTKLGRDFTLYALKKGTLKFTHRLGRVFVNVFS